MWRGGFGHSGALAGEVAWNGCCLTVDVTVEKVGGDVCAVVKVSCVCIMGPDVTARGLAW